jgi:hypothetical protein
MGSCYGVVPPYDEIKCLYDECLYDEDLYDEDLYFIFYILYV